MENREFQVNQTTNIPGGHGQPAAPQPNGNMKPCTACGAPIASKAKVCPRCGAKNKKPIYARVWFWLLIVFVVLVIVIAASSGDDSPKKIEDGGANTSNAAATSAEPQKYKVGDTVQMNGRTLKVNKVERSKGGEWNQAKDGYEYVIVEVTITNAGDSTVSYNTFDFSLQDSNGNITSETFYTSDRNTDLGSGQLASGGTITGTIPFEAPIGDTGLELIYEPDFWSDKQIRIDLQ